MCAQRTHANAGGTRANVAVHNLACLVKHLHFLLRIVILHHLIDLRNHIIGQLMGELFNCFHFTLIHQFAILLLQFSHCSCPGSTGTLIACDVHFFNMTQRFDRLQHHNHHDSGAIRIGNDMTRAMQSVLSIHFGNHQWHIVTHAERTRVINHHRSILGNGLCKFLRNTCSCRG